MEPPVLSHCLVLQPNKPLHSKSQFEWAKIIGAHTLALVVVCAFSFIFAAYLGIRFGEGSALATIGLSFGYSTVSACWTTFGLSTLRFALVPILLFCMLVIQSVVLLLTDRSGTELMVATTVGSIALFALMVLSSFVLRWVSKIRVHHRSNSDEAYSERLRYGISELLLATGVVALLIAVGKTVSVNPDPPGEFKRMIAVFTLLGLFHFILYWPVFLASLTRHRRILTIAATVLLIAITIPAEVMIFSDFMNRRGMNRRWTEEVYPLLLLNMPFVLAIASHLTICYLFGYRLVMRKRETLQTPEPATDSSTVFS